MLDAIDLPDGLGLRDATAADRAMERRIHDANRPDLAAVPGDDVFVRSIYDMQFRARNAGHRDQYPGAHAYMIEQDGEPVGRLLVSRQPGKWQVVDIGLMPAAQGRGIGSAVIRALMTAAADAGAALALSVRSDNPVAARLYEKLGFRPDPDAPPSQMYMFMCWSPQDTASAQGG